MAGASSVKLKNKINPILKGWCVVSMALYMESALQRACQVVSPQYGNYCCHHDCRGQGSLRKTAAWEWPPRAQIQVVLAEPGNLQLLRAGRSAPACVLTTPEHPHQHPLARPHARSPDQRRGHTQCFTPRGPRGGWLRSELTSPARHPPGRPRARRHPAPVTMGRFRPGSAPERG